MQKDLIAKDRAPEAGQLDLSGTDGEESTEPTPAQLRADLARDDQALEAAETERAVALATWPTSDAGSPEYAHLSATAASTEFTLSPADIDVLMGANRMSPQGQSNVIALAIRGAVLQEPHEQLKQSQIRVRDVRPNHVDFRCVLGFYYRDEGKITLLTGSTVPCPFYIDAYYRRINGMPSPSRSGCNMMPTGCYVSRVGTHDGGRINPALRTTDPDDMRSDAVVTVLRTEDDRVYGFGTRDRWDQSTPYDNVHCSYFINYDSDHQAYFSSAGCLTVRGRKESTHQWAKFQSVLSALGRGKRCDLVLLTGREYALAVHLRAASADAASVQRELGRLRVGSMGEEVKTLQSRLGFGEPSGYFGASTKKQLTEVQRAGGHLVDGIYAPQLDAALGWNVFAAPTG